MENYCLSIIRLHSLWNYLAENMENVDKNIYTLCSDIEDVVVKSVLCGLESMRYQLILNSS